MTAGALRRTARRLALSAIAAATRRHPILLPPEAASDAALLGVRAPYAVRGDVLDIDVVDERSGVLRATLLDYRGHFPTEVLWTSAPIPYTGSALLRHDLVAGSLWRAEDELACNLPAPRSRRFCWRLELSTAGGVARRLTGHYRDGGARAVDERYYRGDDYVDYEAQAAGEAPVVLSLIKRFGGHGPVLEVGCATGLALTALIEAGYDATGIDFSEWAIAEAVRKVGADRAFRADIEREPLPGPVAARAPFGVLVLWAVLEHFHDPFAVLRTLSAVAGPGALLLINTTNAGSLSRFALGQKWEGYYDWTHHGVDRISAATLRPALDEVGWDLLELRTEQVWTSDADPLSASLREWCAGDARFRRLLIERDLGDFLTCAARKR